MRNRIHEMNKKIICVLIVFVLMVFVPTLSLYADDSVKSTSKKVCGYKFKLTTTFETKTIKGLDCARVKKISYKITKGKKITGTIKNATITYGGAGPAFYKKDGKWKRCLASDSRTWKLGSISQSQSGSKNAPKSFKYIVLDDTGSVGSNMAITYIPDGKKKKKTVYLDCNY